MIPRTPSTRWQLARSLVLVLVAFAFSAALPFMAHAGRRASTRELLIRAPQQASEFLSPDAHLAVAMANLAMRLVPGDRSY